LSHSGPLVTIIVPTLNQGRFIRESLQSCLNQDHRPLEVLVVDGGSSDETLSILRAMDAPELKWTSKPDQGVVDAVNRGLARATGDFLAIQSSDDILLPGAISAATKVLAGDPAVGLVYGDVEHVDAESKLTGRDVQGEFDLAEYVGRFMYVPQAGAVFTRAALKALGGWREAFSYAADADFWLRLAVLFHVRKLHRTVARYRYHPGQRDTHRARIARDWEGAVRNLIACGRLNARQRRFAEMGIHLARYRYAADGDWRTRTRELYAAVLANPAAVKDPRFPKRELLPGRDPIWSGLSRLKRKLGIKPRGV
jgi:glycosyltransferase involved in cell wall biosynthesis